MKNGEISLNSTNNQQERKMVIPEHFDVFLEEGYEEYADYLRRYVDRIEEEELEDVSDTLEAMGYERGIEMVAGLIAGILGVDKFKIKFQIVKKGKNVKMYGCDRRDNSIVVRRTQEERYEDVLGVSDAVEMIAHECWHTYQNNEVKKNSRRAQLYYKQEYIEPEDDLEGYYRQPYELEAYVFGEMVRNKFSKTRKKVLTRELNKTVGAIAESMTNGNEHLVPYFIEDRDRIRRELREFSEEEDGRIEIDSRRRFSYIH